MTDAALAEIAVRIRTAGRVGRITLNRPKALNALTLEMVEAIHAALDRWRDDPEVAAVVVDAAGDRAFCAGGDIRLLHAGAVGGDLGPAEAFWRAEYRLNHAIRTYPKPYVALIDGITMGGGVGVSIHGEFRVAGDATRFAMPETGIGFYPDVGMTWLLPRLPDHAGVWLGLTGAQLGGADALALGLATHFVPTASRPALITALEAADLDGDGEVLEDVLHAHEAAPGDADLTPQARNLIAEAFALDDVARIRARLVEAGGDWADAQVAALDRASPTGLAVARAAMIRAEDLSFDAALALELSLSLTMAAHPDFVEGVRAAVIDKDRKPNWAQTGDVDALLAARITPPLAIEA